MTRMKGLIGLILAGLLSMPGIFGFDGQALAQSGSGEMTEQQRQEMEQKYQERWRDLERENQKTTGERLQEADQRRRTRKNASGRRNGNCRSSGRGNNIIWPNFAGNGIARKVLFEPDKAPSEARGWSAGLPRSAGLGNAVRRVCLWPAKGRCGVPTDYGPGAPPDASG